MTWISYNVMRHLSHPTNLANHTQTSVSVLVVSASCILASLSPTVRRCVAQCLCYRCWPSAAQNWILLARRKIWKAFSKLHSKYLCLARIKIDIMYVNCSWAVAFCKLRIWVCCVIGNSDCCQVDCNTRKRGLYGHYIASSQASQPTRCFALPTSQRIETLLCHPGTVAVRANGKMATQVVKRQTLHPVIFLPTKYRATNWPSQAKYTSRGICFLGKWPLTGDS